MIIFNSVTKSFGEHLALSDVSCEIADGEFVSIIGPSGAGKTTLAKLLLGAERPTHGDIVIDGLSISHLSQQELQKYRRGIGVIFQDFKLLPHKTVYENISFVLEVCGESDETIASRVPQVLSIVNMTAARDKFPAQLSGGEQQRIAIARAIVHEPKIIIADEPTGNLDHAHTQEVVQLLLTINAFPTTVLLMTHDREIVDGLHKRVIELRDHRIVRDEAVGAYAANA